MTSPTATPPAGSTPSLLIAPSRDDPDVAAASRWIGGPLGAHAAAGGVIKPLRVALAVVVAVLALGFVADEPCRDIAWSDRGDATVWSTLCYSDVAFLYRERGFAADAVPYRDAPLEYPVLTGAVMYVSALAAQAVQGVVDDQPSDPTLAEGVRFYDITTVLMALAAVVVVVATARTVPQRPWDALLVAASPLLLLSATINWDLLAVALASLAILAWTRERPVAAGVLIGLGTAVKLYPFLLLGAIVLVALRSPQRRVALRQAGRAVLAAWVAWAAVNLPVAVWAPEGWRSFFSFNADRGADFGSIWYALDLLRPGSLPPDIDRLVVGSAIVLLGLIALLVVLAPEPPRLAQVAFLAVAAFLLVNKVWSPQYSLWLLPLAALARPRWRDLAIWQGVEMVYFVAVWWYLGTVFQFDGPNVSATTYAIATFLRVAALLWLAFRVVTDMIRPSDDPVRPYLEGVVAR